MAQVPNTELGAPSQVSVVKMNWIEDQDEGLEQSILVNNFINCNGMKGAKRIGSPIVPDITEDFLQVGNKISSQKQHN